MGLNELENRFPRMPVFERSGYSINCQGLVRIDDWSFNLCKSLKAVDIPSTVKGIGDRAFQCCKLLERLGLQEGLERI
eukprot:scaffold6910_cov106-Cylindrotheca_fusiformis.AAC.1